MMSEKPSYEELERRVRELEAAEAELRESRNKYRTLFESANDAIFVASAETGIILDANQKAEQLTGRPRGELIGMHQTALHPESQETYAKTAFQKDAKQKKAVFYEDFLIQHVDGRNIPVEVSPSFIEVQGRPCVLGIFRDVTEKRERMESLQRYEAVVKAVTDPVSYVDREYIYRIVSDAYLGYSGKPRDAIVGHPIWEVMGKDPFETVVRPYLDRCFIGETVRYEDWFSLPDGTWKYQEVVYYPMFDDAGDRVVGVAVFARDQTAQKEAEQALKESEERFRIIFEQAGAGIGVVIPDGRFIEANQALCDMLGYTLEELRSISIMEITHPEDRAREASLVQAIIRGEHDMMNIEKRYFHKDGRPIWVNLSMNTLRDESGNVRYAVGVIVDITDRKHAKEALRASEQKFRNIADNVPGLVLRYKLNPDGSDELLYVSKGVANLFEVSPEDALRDIGLIWSRIYESDLDEMLASIETSHQTLSIWEQEFRIEMSDGRFKWIHACGVPVKQDDESVIWDTLAIDITDRKRAEQALKESEERHKKISALATDYFYELKVDENRQLSIEWVSDSFERVTTYTRDEMKAFEKWMLKIHPEDLADLQQKTADLLTNKPVSSEYRFENRNGDIRWLADRLIPEWSEKENRVVKAYGAVRDITDRKQADAAIVNAHESLSATLDALPDMLFEVDSTGRIHDYHAPKDDMLYVPSELFINKTFSEVLPPHAAGVIQRAISEALAKGKHYGASYVLDMPSGENWYELSIAVKTQQNNHSEDRLIVLARNITDRKNAEAALKKALDEKVTLLREIHHRVKNNMQAIIGLLRMQARRIKDDQLTAIFNDCQNRIGAMSLIHEALYQSENLAKIDFEAYLKKLCRNLAQAHDAPRRGISLTVSAADVSLNMDQGVAVGMVIAELISNAFKHAFPGDEGGAVSVHLNRPDGETVRLIVSDTGKGLPPDFDLQNPSSLGMRLVSGAVTRELGGSIEATNHGGTRFVIRFKCEEGKQSR